MLTTAPWLLRLALQSAKHRRFGLGVTVAAIALSSFLLLTVERARHDVRSQFARTVSGTDLIVGPRTGSVQLLLSAAFHLGGPAGVVSMDSLRQVEADKATAWLVPVALGDSYRGFPVVGTTVGYFKHLQHGAKQPLVLAQGRSFEQVFEAVLGAEVAAQTRHGLGHALTLAHGDGSLSSNDHTNLPFNVVGILARTGTPVDRGVLIDQRGLQALHLDSFGGAPSPAGKRIDAQAALQRDLTPQTATAAFVGLKSRASVFTMQRWVQEFEDEPLMAILPGVTLDELWQAVGLGERLLLALSALVALVSLAGLVAVVVTGLEQRRRELAVLRAVGASPRHVFALLMLEGLGLAALGALLGLVTWWLILGTLGSESLSSALSGVASALGLKMNLGLDIRAGWPRAGEWALLAGVVVAGALASLLPGWRAYRLSLNDGLAPRA
jgi:putative ABC transport system permease protein